MLADRFELAAPLLERLGPAPAGHDERASVAVAVSFWNASVLASKRWYPRAVKKLNALKRSMRGRVASCGNAAKLDLLTALEDPLASMEPRPNGAESPLMAHHILHACKRDDAFANCRFLSVGAPTER